MAPVPVNADILSKIASIIGMFVANIKMSPPIILAHTQAKVEIIIPCLRRTALFTRVSKIVLKSTPKPIEMHAGITKLTISNSK